MPRQIGGRDLLSALATRTETVIASGSPSLTSAPTFQSQARSLVDIGAIVMSGVTTRKRGLVRVYNFKGILKGLKKPTVVVGAELESLVSSHDQTNLAVLLVLQ